MSFDLLAQYFTNYCYWPIFMMEKNSNFSAFLNVKM